MLVRYVCTVRRQLLEGAPRVFGESEKEKEGEADVAKLHAKIGELTMECDFLSGALGRAHAPSAKR
jgi:transposase